ncbi:hypothetical protein AAHB33_17750 [Paenarthrobacter sp. S56]|uniref:hypothetical protein n=1 Tax=Paenarthrobacter sp. S56 TaxID=3138179 RepID=UPI0032196421
MNTTETALGRLGELAIEGHSLIGMRGFRRDDVAAMKMAAERAKDIEDLGHIVLALGIENANELVQLAFQKYGEHSVALSAPADNYEIVAEEAMAAARALRRPRITP